MKIDDLKAKVLKAEEKVEKCKKTIERHEKQKLKKIDALVKKGINLVGLNKEEVEEIQFKNRGDESWEISEVKSKLEDIKGATRKLSDAETILNNWKTKLEAEIEKDNFINNSVPQVIKDFLEEWKNNAYDWHLKKYDAYVEFLAKLKTDKLEAIIECVKTFDVYSHLLNEDGEVKNIDEYSLINVRPSGTVNNFLEEKKLDYRSIDQRKKNFGGAIIQKMHEIRSKEEREQWIKNQLENEKKSKMIDLITRINGIVGTTTDASELSISAKGNLDGFITGTDGKAKIETVGAGGYNIQCFHFRTLVHEVK